MRTNKLYEEHIKPGKFKEIKSDYYIDHVELIASEQDWFTLLLWKYPHLFKVAYIYYSMIFRTGIHRNSHEKYF